MINFEKINYLKNGNSRQRAAYKILNELRVMTLLSEFDPLLAGTIPIGVDIETSDLDIICCWGNKLDFIEKITTQFSGEQGFRLKQNEINQTVIARFFHDPFEIEIFGQNKPTRQQDAYRHMLTEYHLLLQYGEDFCNKIKDLKRQGYKTEPAFGYLLGLSGNPYEALLNEETLRSLNIKLCETE